MLVHGVSRRTIEPCDDGRSVRVIDQTRLPAELVLLRLTTLEEAAHAIRSMQVRGAPLIGIAGAYGLAIGIADDASDAALAAAHDALLATRPTAVNLRWALARIREKVLPLRVAERARAAFAEAGVIADEDVAACRAIGEHGLRLLQKVADYKDRVDVLTHCNAGWLATVDWGTALAPVYRAHDSGVPVHVWVSETRPRNQGASLTAWELGAHGVPHTLVADNACGHLLARKRVDLCIVGADRVTRTGDVANKIGTYLKALAAREANVPFYVAFPRSTVDWSLDDGAKIPIEERGPEEVTTVGGARIAPAGTPAYNPAFDVTPARLVTAFVTEGGTCAASADGLRSIHGAP